MKTKADLERDGQYRPDRHRDRPDEDLAIVVTGEPELLAGSCDNLAKVAFNALVESLPPGAVGAADSMGLTVLATTWSRWLLLSSRLDELSLVPESDDYNRVFRQVLDCEKQIRQFSGEFGLTPKSRTQIKLQMIQASEKKSATEEIDELRDELDQD